MKDIEIARNTIKKDIRDVATNLDLDEDKLILYGKYKAKIKDVDSDKKGKLILVTATNPTPFGEGKTTVSIGLADGLRKLNKNAILALREPSMGPVFGMKGGATGGGYSQVVPMEDINLHFTGDFAAIEAANNLLCAAIDNHIFQGNELGFQRTVFNRCVDVNDRSLREVTTLTSKTSFDITAASEIMALFCLAENLDDLKTRLGNIIIGYNKENKEIYAKDLNVVGAMLVLLKDAFKPNLVQTLEANPAIIHGGPFANIAHGCNSVVATKLALKLSDIVITEAGFGSDLGAEKFFDIKCRKSKIKPDLVIIVTTIKALKYNAGVSKDEVSTENVEKVEEGLVNLKIHVENMLKYNSNVMVCLNKYETDSNAEVDVVSNYLANSSIPFAISTAYINGGSGAVDLSQTVLSLLENENNFKTLYDDNDSIFDKISKISKEIYRSGNVVYSDVASGRIKDLEEKGFGNLPICISKTQYSISDDPKQLGAPINNTLHVRDVKLYNGAGFITVLTGDIISMPGLPKKPNYEKIDFVDNKTVGLS